MKKEFLALILGQHHKMKSSVKKTILIGVGIFSVFLFLTLGALTYAAFQVGGYFVEKAPTQEQLLSLAQSANQQSKEVLGTLDTFKCVDQIKVLLNINVWLSTPMAQISDNIQKACFPTHHLNEEKINEGSEDDKSRI
jgi:hypothetical protein